MPRRKEKTAKKSSRMGAKRGRKAIFTHAQKRVLDRIIREALKEQLRGMVKGL